MGDVYRTYSLAEVLCECNDEVFVTPVEFGDPNSNDNDNHVGVGIVNAPDDLQLAVTCDSRQFDKFFDIQEHSRLRQALMNECNSNSNDL